MDAALGPPRVGRRLATIPVATRDDDDLPTPRDIESCRRCPLWERATHGVAGAGSRHARILCVGEQPGDDEDRQGQPFVGPAGKLLRRALAEAGLKPDDVFLTNAVKHFSWELRGKRRLHKTPGQRAIAACQAWLEREIAALRPAVIVALGSTALRALLGPGFKVGESRLRDDLLHATGTRVLATWHPSAVLRAVDEASRTSLYAALVADLRRAKAAASP
jgi:DNA polymerase